jgi:hypothetical protein
MLQTHELARTIQEERERTMREAIIRRRLGNGRTRRAWSGARLLRVLTGRVLDRRMPTARGPLPDRHSAPAPDGPYC